MPEIKVDPLLDDLRHVAEDFEREDYDVRLIHLRDAKQGELYWDGRQYIYWSYQLSDFVPVSPDTFSFPGTDESNFPGGLDPSLYTKVLNIYRAHGEAIIAALATDPPAVIFTPDDLEDPNDIQTAKAGSKISSLLDKHNDLNNAFVECLRIAYNQPLLAAYTYYDKKSEYGETTRADIKEREHVFREAVCPECGAEMQNVSKIAATKSTPIDAKESECVECELDVIPEIKERVEKVFDIEGWIHEPKGRQKIQFFGATHVKIPPYARNQEDCPYLILEFEQHESVVRAAFPGKADLIHGSMPQEDDSIESRVARQSTYEDWSDSARLVTVKYCWLRPAAFWSMNPEQAKAALRRFPEGALIIMAGDVLLDAYEEKLDDHWRILNNPLSTHLHFQPVGRILIPVQDVTNDSFNLVLQTMEHAIQDTFADPEVLNFEDYQKFAGTPGLVYPAKPIPGRSLGESFYERKPASLSREIEPFQDRMNTIGQFLLGSQPAVYGGSIEGGSKTFAEYAMSRQQALQRLSLIWKFLSKFWAQVMGMAVSDYIRNMVQDEHFTLRKGKSFEKVVIRLAEVEGKLGTTEPESTDQFPVSWAQKRDMIIQLLESQNPSLQGVLMDPMNLNTVANLLGFNELHIPGEQDRLKQLNEIEKLLKSPPLEEGQSSVPIEPLMDNHYVHKETIRGYLVSDEGVRQKEINKEGYENIIAHYLEHENAEAQLRAGPGAPQEGVENEGEQGVPATEVQPG